MLRSPLPKQPTHAPHADAVLRRDLVARCPALEAQDDLCTVASVKRSSRLCVRPTRPVDRTLRVPVALLACPSCCAAWSRSTNRSERFEEALTRATIKPAVQTGFRVSTGAHFRSCRGAGRSTLAAPENAIQSALPFEVASLQLTGPSGLSEAGRSTLPGPLKPTGVVGKCLVCRAEVVCLVAAQG